MQKQLKEVIQVHICVCLLVSISKKLYVCEFMCVYVSLYINLSPKYLSSEKCPLLQSDELWEDFFLNNNNHHDFTLHQYRRVFSSSEDSLFLSFHISVNQSSSHLTLQIPFNKKQILKP